MSQHEKVERNNTNLSSLFQKYFGHISNQNPPTATSMMLLKYKDSGL